MLLKITTYLIARDERDQGFPGNHKAQSDIREAEVKIREDFLDIRASPGRYCSKSYANSMIILMCINYSN